MSTPEENAYYGKVNNRFADLMYSEMASERYGLEMCCAEENDKWKLKKELLDFNAQVNPLATDNDPTTGIVISGVCESLNLFSANGGGDVTYTPCGSFKSITTRIPGKFNDSIDICYDINKGYAIADIDAFNPQDLVVTTGETCTA